MALDRDRMNGVSADRAANAAMKVVSELQVRFEAEEQMVGLTAAFMLLAKKHGMTPGDLFTVTDNVVNGLEGKRPEFRAVEQYLKEEL